ncbi:HET-domain-containing protein, partial [Hypoxylon sp. FL1857]
MFSTLQAEPLGVDGDMGQLSHLKPMTPPIDMPSAQRVCDQCLELNLTAFLDGESTGSGEMKKYHIPIKKPKERFGSTDCALCNILSRSIYTYTFVAQETFSPDEEDYELRALKFSTLISLNEKGIPGDDYILALINVSQRQYGGLSQFIMGGVGKEGYAIIQRTSGQRKYVMKPPFDRFNTQQTLDWILECNNHNQTSCRPLRRPTHYQYVVDCHKLSVVAAEKSYQYVALSYVWGSSSSEMAAYSLHPDEDSKTLLLSKKLPLVVTDAIAVTKSLGFRYLWIDKFCIAQDQPEIKHRQIEEMDAVYANSELTIIAAAGQDENYGLPGVSRRSRTTIPVAELGNLRISWLQNPQSSIRRSKWQTRGWTYQEAFMARRRLVFLDDQTYFECGSGEKYEMMHNAENPFNPLGHTARGLWNYRTRLGTFELLEDMLGDYTSRELSYDEDSLLAFAGVLNYLQAAPSCLKHLWGVPWTIKVPNDYFNISYSARNVFFAGICWRHSQSCWAGAAIPRRRLLHPSWTWAGWAGKVNFGATSVFRAKNIRPNMQLRQVMLENEDGDRVTMADAATGFTLDDMYRYPILFIETRAISPDQIHFLETPYSSFEWTVGGHKVLEMFLSEGANSKVELAKYLKRSERWRCVLIGTYEIIQGSFIDTLLILRKEVDKDLWVRVGVMDLLYIAAELSKESTSPTEEFRI